MPENFARLILESYYAEMEAHHTYMLLAQLAPNEGSRRIMEMNAHDEHHHAEEFEEIYEELTGMEPPPNGIMMTRQGDEVAFREGLRAQLFDEWNDFKKYSNMMRMTDNPQYRDTLFAAAQDELRHAMLDTYLLNA